MRTLRGMAAWEFDAKIRIQQLRKLEGVQTRRPTPASAWCRLVPSGVIFAVRL